MGVLKFKFGFTTMFLWLSFLLVSSIVITPPVTLANCNQERLQKLNHISEVSPLLTWTSRTQTESLPINNESSLIGDHVLVNATFPEELNVSHSELKIWNGFTYNTTRPLVVPTDPSGVFEGIIDPSQFDWVIIPGIEAGLSINITCEFTNSDSDFMVWPDSIDPSARTYENNIVNMISGDSPEHDSIIWPETGSMHLACLDYSCEAGNWTLLLEVGERYTSYANGSSVTIDTYNLARLNATYDILATGYSASNETYQIMRNDVLLCNFFAPHVTVFIPQRLPTDERTFNITWSSIDGNLDDVNYYSVWLSNNDGFSFMLIAQNLTRTWCTWNSDGWLEDYYIIRIRAYSIDLTNPNNDVSDPPAGYWPGDYGDGFSYPFSNFVTVILQDLCVSSPSDIMYEFGATENIIIWRFTFSGPGHQPEYFSYVIYKDSEVIASGSFDYHHGFIPEPGDGSVRVDVSGLQVGVYNYTIYCRNPGANGGYISDVVIVTVNSGIFTDANYVFLFYSGLTFLIISLTSIAIIVIYRISGKGFDSDVIKRIYSCSKIRLKSKLCTNSIGG